jgi:hypothetical protein
LAIAPEAKPMAMLQYDLGAYGAIGSRLMFCGRSCRVLDPGVNRELIAVVPRTKEVLVLGYKDGRNGLYTVPQAGGRPVPEHPLVAAIRQVMAKRPRDAANR